jgi:hypothetical protein
MKQSPVLLLALPRASTLRSARLSTCHRAAPPDEPPALPHLSADIFTRPCGAFDPSPSSGCCPPRISPEVKPTPSASPAAESSPLLGTSGHSAAPPRCRRASHRHPTPSQTTSRWSLPSEAPPPAPSPGTSSVDQPPPLSMPKSSS